MAMKKQMYKVQDVKAISFSFPEVASTEVYIKVDSIQGTKSSLVAKVNYIVSGACVETQIYPFVPLMDGGNFIAQAYNHLKTLPEFAGATDC